MKLILVVACLVLMVSSSPIRGKRDIADDMKKQYDKFLSTMGEYGKIPSNMAGSYIPGGMPDFIKKPMEQAGNIPEKYIGGIGSMSGNQNLGGMPDFIKNPMEQVGSIPEKYMGGIGGIGGTSGNQNSGGMPDFIKNPMEQIGSFPEKFMGIGGASGNPSSGGTSNSENNQAQTVNVISSRALK